MAVSEGGVARVPDQATWRLSVKDFGPIGEAAVEMRPLTVFVGRSNTGKTYLATLAYALRRCFGGREAGYGVQGRWRIPLSALAAVAVRLVKAGTAADEGVRKAMDRWRRQVSAGSVLLPLPAEVDDYVRRTLNDMQKDTVTFQLRYCHGIQELPRLIRWPDSPKARVAVDMPEWLPGTPAEYVFEARRDGTLRSLGPIPQAVSPFNVARRSPRNDVFLRLVRHSVVEREATRSLLRPKLVDLFEFVINEAHSSWLCPLPGRAYYLPADRTGIMNAHGAIANSILQSVAASGLQPALPVPLFSGVLAEFLSDMNDLSADGASSGHEALASIARAMEEAVVGGSVRAERSEADHPRFLYRQCESRVDIPLMRASSMVSELAPIILYLRHMVHPGDLLIIDEPESHLHPGIQVELVRCLARVVRAGVNVMITTHSEWVLDELNNIVLASKLPGKAREGGSRDTSLRPYEVGIWSFEQRPLEGAVVREIVLDDDGVYVSGFNDVATKTYNEWAKMADLLEGAR